MNPTLGDLVAFVLLNRSDKSFVGFTEPEITECLVKHIGDNTLYYTTEYNRITGMIIATVDSERRVLFIDENLAMNLTNLRQFAIWAREQFNGIHLMWRKHGVYKHHNTDKVYDKLISRRA